MGRAWAVWTIVAAEGRGQTSDTNGRVLSERYDESTRVAADRRLLEPRWDIRGAERISTGYRAALFSLRWRFVRPRQPPRGVQRIVRVRGETKWPTKN